MWSTTVLARLLTIIYFASAAVAVDSSHMTASSSASWNRFSPPSNFVNGHALTKWFMVCCWPQLQEADWARPRLCKLAWHGPWPANKWLPLIQTADLLNSTAVTTVHAATVFNAKWKMVRCPQFSTPHRKQKKRICINRAQVATLQMTPYIISA